MNMLDEILQELMALRNEATRQNLIKLGIPADSCIGVSTTMIRKLAKSYKYNDTLADALWSCGYHEGKLLAVLLWNPKAHTLHAAKAWMHAVCSWDLCDHLCKNLIVELDGWTTLIQDWCTSPSTYEKRGAFTLMATHVMRDEALPREQITEYCEIIFSVSDDSREHVKKAVLWALREIGKSNWDNHELAIQYADRLLAQSSGTQKWIGKQALKELSSLCTAGRRRLISDQSQMAKERKNRT